MSPVAAPDAVASIVERIAAIQYQLGSLQGSSATSAAASGISSSGPSSATVSAADSSTLFASTLSEAVQTAATQATSATRPAPAAGAGPTGDDVIAAAKKYLGVPYVWGGTSTAGLDCSGLVQRAFADVGIDLPRVSRDQAKTGEAVASLADAQPGDLVAFGSPVDHIAIYLGDNMILEAPQPGSSVHITEMYRTPTAIRRVVPGGDGSGVSGVDQAGGQFAATKTATEDAAQSATGAGDGSDTTAAGASRATTMGIPPSLLAKFDLSQLAGIPRAIPVAALGFSATTDDASDVLMIQAVDGASGTAAVGGLSAQQLLAAGMSTGVAQYADQFAAAEQRFGLPSGVLAAIAQAESGGDAGAISTAGAQGLMQLMPSTAAGLGVTDPFDAAQAIDGAARYLSDNLAAFGGSLTEALAAYNAGPGAVRQYGGVPPYAETQNYVQKITDLLARLT